MKKFECNFNLKGAAAFLYNPCSDPREIEHFRSLAKNCLRRHIITPFKNLPKGQFFNIVTYGCKLELNTIFGQEKLIASYLRVGFWRFLSVKLSEICFNILN